MKELQLRLLKKQLTTKFFFILGQKCHFSQKIAAPSKKSYSPNYVYWYQCFNVWKMVGAKSSVHGRLAQCFCHSIDSHCLCMWVKNETFYCNSWFKCCTENNLAWGPIFCLLYSTICQLYNCQNCGFVMGFVILTIYFRLENSFCY